MFESKSISRLIFILSAILILTNLATALIINIPEDFATIQEGLNQSTTGDTVLLARGDYNEGLIWPEWEVILGSTYILTGDTTAKYETIIYGQEGIMLYAVSSEGVHLRGLTLQNGFQNRRHIGVSAEDFSLEHVILADIGTAHNPGIIFAEVYNLQNVEITNCTGLIISGEGEFDELSYTNNSYPLHVVGRFTLVNSIIDGNCGGILSEYNENNDGEVLIQNCLIRDNDDSGLVIFGEGDYIVRDLMITGNDAFQGAGIMNLVESPGSVLFEGVTISGNHAYSGGGGIWLTPDSEITLRNCSIHDNTSDRFGGGIYVYEEIEEWNIQFDNNSRSSVYNNSARCGDDFYYPVDVNMGMVIPLDTATTELRSAYTAFPPSFWDIHALNYIVDPIDQDVFVSPDGDDSSSGLTPHDPFKTIKHAMIHTSRDQTIHLAAGTYSGYSNEEVFPVFVQHGKSLQGVGREEVILNATLHEDYAVYLASYNGVLEGITLQNARYCGINFSSGLLRNATVQNCVTDGIYFPHGTDEVQFQNVTIRSNGGNGITGSAQQVTADSLRITNNNGIGLISTLGEVLLSNSTISGNQRGGINTESLTAENLHVHHNMGTGISAGAILNISGCSVHHNSGNENAGGLDVGQIISYDNENPSSFYLNASQESSQDIFIDSAIETEITIDTATVAEVDPVYIDVPEEVIVRIRTAIHPQVTHDLYVDPVNGDDSNSGIDEENALQSLSQAVLLSGYDSENPGSIFLADGEYSAESNNEHFPIYLASYTRIINEDGNAVFRSVEGQTQFTLDNCETIELSGLHLTQQGENGNHIGSLIECTESSNVLFQNLEIDYITNEVFNLRGAQVELNSVRISECEEIIQSWMSRITIKRTLMNNNSGGITSEGRYVYLFNSTIAENLSTTNFFSLRNCSIISVNSIVWNPAIEFQISAINFGFYPYLVFTNSLVHGGENGVEIQEGDHIEFDWLEGNLSVDPEFQTDSYFLSVESPCIDAGTDFFYWNHDSLYTVPRESYIGIAPDMGAFEFDPTVVQPDHGIHQPSSFKILSASPNPFNTTTRLRIEIPYTSNVTLTIYDLLGREVLQLIRDELSPGIHSVEFDGSSYAIGVYIAQVTVDDIQTHRTKLLYVK
ncbi:right-handed parallel beta-helix repeat-containing protein [bacterium]|nr:right-handed parallel beta-helix repeat-containing protein [bacterium]